MPSPAASPERGRRRWRRWVYGAALAVWAATTYWHSHKPLPPGLHVTGEPVTTPLADLTFLADVTSADAYGRPVMSQAIFDEVLGIVHSARELLVLDYFLFNDHRGTDASVPHRALSGELRDALIERRRAEPGVQILLLVDPINDVYGAQRSADLALLSAAGVEVARVDLDALRDSNPLYTGVWRLALRWWGSGGGGGWLPNPLDADAPPIPLRAWARLANFKADHRKVIVGDDGNGRLVGIVGSANPHDASSGHSNVAMKVSGPALEPLLASELDVARFSGWRGEIRWRGSRSGALPSPGSLLARVQVLTEGAILAELKDRLDATSAGDAIDVAMFYIADRNVVDSLLAAARRGARVRLILDPNKDAFGRARSGIPNRPLASELAAASDGAIQVRWYRTHGEQFHAKLVSVDDGERLWLTLGSANLTRRNLGDYNLEANIGVELPRGSQLAVQVVEYFDSLWSNRAPLGIEYTADLDVYSDPAASRYWLYRFMESTGLSTF
jgi:phosphatidylserine/phosphatidylglycerophosphate/cardiolipin synthase-like enzyme